MDVYRTDRDRFFKAGQSVNYYLARLRGLGCSEELIERARLLAKGQPFRESLYPPHMNQWVMSSWDGSDLYFSMGGDWGVRTGAVHGVKRLH